MATRTKYGTKEALGSAKQSSRTAVAGGSSVTVKSMGQIIQQFKKEMASMGKKTEAAMRSLSRVKAGGEVARSAQNRANFIKYKNVGNPDGKYTPSTLKALKKANK